jgi:oxygen-dependent protoporphyrinogen oxidase
VAGIVETDVTIIGGGLSGLATAHYLARGGFRVEILEKSARTGGTIETHRRNGFLIDCGPNSALDTTPLLGALFEAVGIADTRRFANEEAKNRYIVRNGQLQELPMTPLAFLKTRLFSRSAKWRLLREPFIPPADPDRDETVAEFVERRLGREILDYAINPFVSGVYAGSPESLSVRAAFPRLHRLEQRYGSLIRGAIEGRRERKRQAAAGEASKQSARLFSFDDGMQAIVDALSAEQGGSVHTSVDVVSVRKSGAGYEVDASTKNGDRTFSSRAVVFAVPAYALAGLPVEFEFPLRSALASIQYPPVSMVFFGYTVCPTDVPLDGFGFLVPERERRGILGTIWSSTLFPGRAPEGGAAFTTFVGGSRSPEQALLPERDLTASVQADLRELLRVHREPDTAYVRLWEQAIPQYNVGHMDVMRELEAFETRNAGCYITGNFRGGVSVGDCVRQAYALGAKITSNL